VAKGSLGDRGDTLLTKEIELSSKNETTKKVLKASSAVVENVDGKAVGMVTVLSDITRQKEVDGMKEHFVSLVTHELRTPVVAIQKSLELLLSKATGGITEDQEKFLTISRMNVDRLNKLINDLLDMSQMESGKFVLKPSAFDFRDVVRDARGSLVSWADEKKISIRLDMKEEPTFVTGDRNRLFQVVVNLLSNALKFTPSGGEIAVAVKIVQSVAGDLSGPGVEVSVVDNGIGIDPKDFQRIFNKFEQVSLVAPQGMAGSGLGLPISKEIIGLHNGKIWVESEQGKGSRFIFVIPQALKTKEA
jgi:signal transduction histidine kinase